MPARASISLNEKERPMDTDFVPTGDRRLRQVMAAVVAEGDAAEYMGLEAKSDIDISKKGVGVAKVPCPRLFFLWPDALVHVVPVLSTGAFAQGEVNGGAGCVGPGSWSGSWGRGWCSWVS